MKNFLLAMLFLVGFAHASNAAPLDALIDKARAQLGSEEVLENVETLSFECSWINAEGEKIANLRLIYKAPNLQRIETEFVDGQTIKTRKGYDEQVTAINGYEGFNRFMNTAEDQWRISLLDPQDVFRLSTNTVENLNFYEGYKRMRGEAVYKGETTFRGEPAVEIEFRYPRDITYHRYFDPATGKLIGTVMPLADGNTVTMVEEGTQQVAGINFPEKTESYNNDQLVRTIVFDKITVNGEIDNSKFQVPSIVSSD